MLTVVWLVILFVGGLIVTGVCAAAEMMLLARMYRDCWPCHWHEFWYTASIVLFFGIIIGLCGFGAYTIAHASIFELLGMMRLHDARYHGE